MNLRTFSALGIGLLVAFAFNACGGSSSHESGKSYSLNAADYELIPGEDGHILRLTGVDSVGSFDVPSSHNSERVVGEFHTQHLAAWWDHPAHDEPLSDYTEEIVLETSGEVLRFLVSDLKHLSYDPASAVLEASVVHMTTEKRKGGSAPVKRNGSSSVSLSLNTGSATAPGPLECLNEAPPQVDGLDFKWVQPVWAWNPARTGAAKDVSIYSLNGPDGYYSLGDLAAATLTPKLECGGYVVKDVSGGDLLKLAPLVWEIWNDQGSRGAHDVSIYLAEPFAGYTCLGAVVLPEYTIDIPNIPCVRSDLLEPESHPTPLLWQDNGSGANRSISLFRKGAQQDPGVTAPFVPQREKDGYAHTPTEDTRRYFYQFKR